MPALTSNKHQGQHLHTDNNESNLVGPDSYLAAEQKAKWYFGELLEIVKDGQFLKVLEKDLSELNAKFSNDRGAEALSSLEATAHINTEVNSWSFLKKLSAEKKLRSYLDKSVTYIFMRDLGKDINQPQVDKSISQTVNRLHRWIVNRDDFSGESAQESLSTSWLFQKAKHHDVESSYIWLMGKLAKVQRNLPQEIDQTNGMRKLVKIIAGVVMHQLMGMPPNISSTKQKLLTEQAIRLGYYYGLTYPLIDDLQDSALALNDVEKEKFNQAIRNSLLKGRVEPFPTFSKKNQSRMRFIYEELSESFEFIRYSQSEPNAARFFEQAFIFFEAQDIDRKRKLGDKQYTYEEIFVPLILKSAGCRLVARDMLGANLDSVFDRNTFCFGIYNQFNDDIKDVFDDMNEGNVTPYTYYLEKKQNQTKSTAEDPLSMNPYHVYWAVVYFLIYRVYKNNPRCKKLILERSVNAHKSVLNTLGENEYKKIRTKLLNTNNCKFDKALERLVLKPNDVAWFDKLVSRHVAQHFETSRNLQESFKNQYEHLKQNVEAVLPINKHHRLQTSHLVNAANYSLQAGGKRIRSVIAHLMMSEFYQLPKAALAPVLRLLEYMHTASIVFDDKPSQDNADLRRGLPTLHKKLNCEATAELAGIVLMMKAVEVQSEISSIDSDFVLQSLAYASSTTQAICEGQALDLYSKHTRLDLSQLEKMSELKTGLAIEAAFMIPAILAGENDIQKGHIKHFAKHLGLAFQIKDDLLDYEGDGEKLGKPISQDSLAGKSSFVTCLGEAKAREKLFEHYFQASQLLVHFASVRKFMQAMLDYVIFREN